MKTVSLSAALAASLLATGAFSVAQAQDAPRDLRSDSWVAVDDLGRATPMAPRPPQPNKTVAMFYYIANSSSENLDLQNSNTAHQTPNKLFDISKLLAANPADPKWGPQNQAHWWGEPLFGYYLNDDPWVIRHHLSMLADAGVDALFFDVTNGVTYRSAYMAIFKVALQMRREGNATPKFAFVTHARGAETATKLFQEIYQPKRYADLWFLWDGKPLLIGDQNATYTADYNAANMAQFDDQYLASPTGNWKKGDALPDDIKGFFTWRESWAWTAPNGWFGDGKDKWPWLDDVPQKPGLDAQGKVEEIVVSPAQHPTTNKGRSYSAGKEPPLDKYGLTPDTDKGVYYAEQWQRALQVDAPLLWITQWNEWTAMRNIATPINRPGMLGRQIDAGESFFVDVYNREFTRDLEPMAGGWGDNYYLQTFDNIRRFKGARPTPVDTQLATAPDGAGLEYLDTIGDNATRDWPGWGGNRYQNRSGRNDIVSARVAASAQTIYFSASTRDDLTPQGGGRWMQLLVDADRNHETGWNGYDFCINYAPRDAKTCAIARWNNGRWTEFATAPIQVDQKQVRIAVPRAILNQTTRVAFDFHWVDNAPIEGDVKAFWTDGDSAPNGRFNYRYQNTAAAR